MRRKLLGGDHPAIATSLNNLAVVLTELCRGRGGMYREALEIRRKKLEANHPAMLLLESNLAYVAIGWEAGGRGADARPDPRRSTRISRRARQLPLLRHELGLCCQAWDAARRQSTSGWRGTGSTSGDASASELKGKIAGDLAGLYKARGRVEGGGVAGKGADGPRREQKYYATGHACTRLEFTETWVQDGCTPTNHRLHDLHVRSVHADVRGAAGRGTHGVSFDAAGHRPGATGRLAGNGRG